MIDKIDSNSFFKFYDLCVPVKGYKKGAIYDLQRSNFFDIPNSVINMLKENEGKRISELYTDYGDSKDLVTKYLSVLIENEVIFITNELDRFPGPNFEFKKPYFLDILFVEINKLQKSKLQVLDKINSLGCIQLVLVTNGEVDLNLLEKILHIVGKSKLQIISLISEYGVGDKNVIEIQSKNFRLRDITFYNANEELCNKEEKIFYKKTNLYKTLTRTISSLDDFILNDDFFKESLKYNVFFNRKAYIDNGGDIKHYINDQISYGNIDDVEIFDVIQTEPFRELWNINKDKIDRCKVCQYRYMCADNRIPIKVNEKKYRYKTKCGYNPISDTWN